MKTQASLFPLAHPHELDRVYQCAPGRELAGAAATFPRTAAIMRDRLEKDAGSGVPLNAIFDQSCSEVRMVQATTLQPGQYRHLLRVTKATSRHPERDVAVLLLGIHCGVRVTEIAQIEVSDLLYPSGALKPEVSLRAAITKGCRQRCIYPTNLHLVDALDSYFAYRLKRRLRLGMQGRYRGLDPDSKLILTLKGQKFHLNTKRRINQIGEQVDYLASASARHAAL
jgi:integrase